MHVSMMTLSESIRGLNAREFSSQDLVREAVDRIERTDPQIHAFLEVLGERAINDARAIDDRRARGERVGPLAGIPLAIKDNICREWGRTTCASKMLAEYRSPYTATCVQRLLDADAVILGKTNLDEFAMGSSCESSAFGPTRNPWDHTRVPGGSSGGSGAAVAAGMIAGALGSDTGGSIRQPAGWCNICGLKPTYGRVSRSGVVAYASSLDQVGPMARTVRDCAILAEIISGHDPRDSTSVPKSLAAPLCAVKDLDQPIKGLVVGVPRASGAAGGGAVDESGNHRGNHPDVDAAIERAVKVLRDQGATVVDVDLQYLDQAIAAYYIIATAEASSNLARFDGVRYGHRAQTSPAEDLATMYARSRAEGLGSEVQRRILLGTYVLSAGYADRYYHTALKVRRLIKNAYDQLFRGEAADASGHTAPACDVLLMPSSPGPAFRLGEPVSNPVALYLEDVYTVGVNLAGLPAITVPGGFAQDLGRSLPIGVQFIGAPFQESRLLRAARMFEQATEHWKTPLPT
jgi:aspartyl-tRNA(Asn)/glutamyl-tRNA(Gln) amidotransferase subunit A